MAQESLVGQDLLITAALWSHSDTPHSVRLLWTNDRPDAETSTWQHTTFTRNTHPFHGRIRTHYPSKREATAPRLPARRVEEQRHEFPSSTTDGGEWGVCLRQKPHNLSTRIKVGSREGMDIVEEIKISCPSQKWNPGHPARIRSLYWLRNGNLTSSNLAMIMHLSTSPARATVWPTQWVSCLPIMQFFCFLHIRRTLKGEILHDVARTEHSAEEQLLMIQKGEFEMCLLNWQKYSEGHYLRYDHLP